jgi:hypothetical protein
MFMFMFMFMFMSTDRRTTTQAVLCVSGNSNRKNFSSRDLMIRRETGVILIENFVIAPAEAVGLSRESD